MTYQLVSFSDDISVHRCHVERSQDICRTQMYCMHSAISPKAKKDSSHFAFSYVFKINFYEVKIYFTHVKIYFYIHVPRFVSSIGFLCRNFSWQSWPNSIPLTPALPKYILTSTALKPPLQSSSTLAVLTHSLKLHPHPVPISMVKKSLTVPIYT